MKKVVMFLVVFLMLSVGLSFGEGVREHSDPTGIVTVKMPEQAPDFLIWPGRTLDMKRFPNGRSAGIVEVHNEDQSVWAILSVIRQDEKLFVLLVQVTYFYPEFFKTADPKYIKTEYYVDKTFFDTNVPTNTLVRVEEVSKTPINFFIGRSRATI